jgi:hypothetical protein
VDRADSPILANLLPLKRPNQMQSQGAVGCTSIAASPFYRTASKYMSCMAYIIGPVIGIVDIFSWSTSGGRQGGLRVGDVACDLFVPGFCSNIA